MRRKRRVWYEVTRSGNLWLYDKDVGWNSKFGGSHRYFNTAHRAFNHAETLPLGSVVIKWYYKKGTRYIQEFIKE